MNLDARSVLAKRSAAEDFTFQPPVEAAVEVEAGRWLQILAEGSDPKIAALVRVGDAWWAMLGRHEDGTDRSGRRLASLHLGRLAEVPGPAVGSLLQGLFWLDTLDGGIEPVAVSGRPDDLVLERAICLLVLGLPAVVGEPADASRLVARLPDAIRWLALLPTRVPPRLPPDGVVVSRAAGPSQPLLERMVQRTPPFDWAALVRLGSGRGEQLARVALDAAPLAEAFSAPELRWLLGTAARGAVLEAASSQEIRCWIEEGILTREDLPAVAPRLDPADRPAAARYALSVAAWRALFPDRGGIEHAFSADARVAWAALSAGLPCDPAALPEIEEAGLAEDLSLAALARVHRHLPALTPLFRSRLGSRLPSWLVVALHTGRIEEGPLEGVPEPDAEWLAGVEPAVLARLGNDLLATPLRGWWLRAVGAHPERPEPEPLTYARARFAEGQIGEAAALEVARRLGWRTARPLLDDIGRGAGLSLLEGSADTGTAALRDLRALVDAGVLSADEVIAAVRNGAEPRLLHGVFQAATVGILDLGVGPPVEPPPWDERLTDLLSGVAGRRAFWDRWDGTLSHTMTRWLDGVLAPTSAGTLVRHLSSESGLPDPVIELVAGALPQARLIGLVLEATGAARERVLGRLRRDLEVWLRNELTTVQPAARPALTAHEMVALLPLLAPRDVLREVFARPVEPDEHALLDAIVKRLHREPVYPLPAPDDAVRRLRPDWCDALGRLAGWGHWRLGEE